MVALLTVEVVVKDQLSAAAAFPAWSRAPLTSTVYVAAMFRDPVGVNVTVLVVGLYEVVPGTGLEAGSRSTKLIVPGWTDSPKVAVTVGAVIDTPVAPGAGVRPVTAGGVVSLPYRAA
jgi:hypothetical protein